MTRFHCTKEWLIFLSNFWVFFFFTLEWYMYLITEETTTGIFTITTKYIYFSSPILLFVPEQGGGGGGGGGGEPSGPKENMVLQMYENSLYRNNIPTGFTRSTVHINIYWSQCIFSPSYKRPLHYLGKSKHTCSLTLLISESAVQRLHISTLIPHPLFICRFTECG